MFNHLMYFIYKLKYVGKELTLHGFPKFIYFAWLTLQVSKMQPDSRKKK